MNIRAILLAVVSLGLAGGTAMYAKNWMLSERDALLSQVKSQPKQQDMTQILVAKKDIPAGMFVKPEFLTWQNWPKDAVTEAYTLKGKTKITDFSAAVSRVGIPAKSPILSAQVVYPGEQGFLAAVLTPGMRATSVKVTATSGIAGFVFPGDRVDLLLTMKYKNGNTKRVATRTFMDDLRVLAVDQRIQNKENAVKVAKTATLEVTPTQAEKIAVATRMGSLSMVLRSIAREEDDKVLSRTDSGKFTRDSQVFSVAPQGKKKAQRKVQVMRGTQSHVAKF